MKHRGACRSVDLSTKREKSFFRVKQLVKTTFLGIFIFCSSQQTFAEELPGNISTEAAYLDAKEAMIANLDDPEANFRFAQAATDVGDFRGAIAALERVLLIKPALANIKFELGLLHLRVGDSDLASYYIQKSLESPEIPPDIRVRAEEYLARAEAQSMQSQLFGNLFMGYRYETNANAAPGTNIVGFNGDPSGFLTLSDESTEQEDTSFLISLALRHLYKFESQQGHQLETSFFISSTNYDDVTDLNTQVASIEIGPRFFLSDDLSGDLSIRPYLSTTYLRLDDAGYLFAYSGGLNLRKVINAQLTGNIDLEYGHESNHDTAKRPVNSDRTGDLATLRAGFSYQWSSKTLATISAHVANKDANEGFESYTDYGIDLGLYTSYTSPIPYFKRNWSSSLNFGYAMVDYDDPEIVIDPNNAREDDRFRARFNTDIPLTTNVKLSFTVAYTDNDSNFDIDKYDNTSYMLGMNFAF